MIVIVVGTAIAGRPATAVAGAGDADHRRRSSDRPPRALGEPLDSPDITLIAWEPQIMTATAHAVLWGRLSWHPAVEAWSGCSDGPVEPPEHIEILNQSKTSATYRLVGGNGASGSVVARRSLASGATIERTVHERILPALPITAPQYRGFHADGNEHGWIFLEAVGDERYSPVDPAHRELAARWTAKLHTAATAIAARASLPAAGPSRYVAYLRAARRIIRDNISNPRFTGRDVRMLERVTADLDALDDVWADIEGACSGVPPTLSHGDYRLRHALVRHSASRDELLLIAWDAAGWGVPTVDLTHIDLATYLSVVELSWPAVQLADLERLAAVGHVFGHLAAIRALSLGLAVQVTHELRPLLATLESLHGGLARAIDTLAAPHAV